MGSDLVVKVLFTTSPPWVYRQVRLCSKLEILLGEKTDGEYGGVVKSMTSIMYIGDCSNDWSTDEDVITRPRPRGRPRPFPRVTRRLNHRRRLLTMVQPHR
ncbi:uncharacterized protein LOC143913583 [Arctopsyche grandis]|uniref:uncharacterized protein LOC143913583 n=1 Tax=Arctopsyche grandis TaxID=121162 RepID=UPI00406D9106